MKRLKTVATSLAMGLGLVYLLFMWRPVEALFPVSFMTLLRQIIALSFAVCVLISPDAIVRAAEQMVPKVIGILTMMFTNKKKDDGTME